MKLKITLIIFLKFAINCYGQNSVTSHYEYQNKTDSLLFFSKDSLNSLNCYIKFLFNDELYTSIVSNDFWLNAIKLSTITNKLNLSDSFFRQNIKSGLHKDLYFYYKKNEPNLLNYFNSNLAIKLELDYDKLYQNYQKKIDMDLENQFNSFLGQDQITRNISDIPQLLNVANTSIKDSIVKYIIDYSDCDIKLQLFEILTLYNWKSNICYKRPVGLLIFLMLHNLRNFKTTDSNTMCMSDFEYYNKVQPKLFKLVKSGLLQNRDYAYLIDRAHCWNNYNGNAMQIYGTHITSYNKKKYMMYPIFDIDNVDKRRAEIFLPSLFIASFIDDFELPKNYKFKK